MTETIRVPRNGSEPAAFNPALFEEHVRKAATPVKPIRPDMRAHLARFIERHAPGVTVEIGEVNGYDWRTGIITITEATAAGEGLRSLLTVAHECAHWQQHQEWPWLKVWMINWIPGARLWLEDDAWRRALTMLS